jgi:UBX domain-containing protein 6
LQLASQGIFFKCPLVGEDVLPRDEIKAKIKEFLYAQLSQA